MPDISDFSSSMSDVPSQPSPVVEAQGSQVQTPDTSVESPAAPVVAETGATAVIGNEEVTDQPEGVQSGSTSAADDPSAQFTTNPQLRSAYNEVVAKLKPHEELITQIEERGGADYFQMANEIYDSYVGSEADPTRFLQHLHDLSPTAFRQSFGTLVEQNRDALISEWFGGAIAPEDFDSFRQWKETGGVVAQPPAAASPSGDQYQIPEYDEETGERIPQSIRQMMQQQMQQLTQFQTAEQKREAEATRQAGVAREADIDRSIDTYQQDRLKVIGRTVEQMGLADSAADTPDQKEEKGIIRSIIESTAMRNFGQDERSRNLYQRAMDHLAAGEVKPAQGLAYQIEAQLAQHASKVAARVAQWRAAESKLREQQVQQAAEPTRPEISQNGQAVGAGLPQNQSYTPFSNESVDARLEQLRASGRIR